jgi:hypothetical protein
MKIKPFWTNEYTNFNYVKTYFKDEEQLTKWTSCGHIRDSISIEIFQIKTDSVFLKPIKDFFPSLKNLEICFHKLTPGHYLPMHNDKYGYYSKFHNVRDINQIQRYIIFLENSQPGHLLIIKNKIISKWKSGDIVGWRGDTPHSALNFGVTNRFTLQITGINES